MGATKPGRQPRVRLTTSKQVDPAAVKALFRAAGWTEDIAHYRPAQIDKLLRHSYLVLTAWSEKDKLVGFASAVSDGVLCGLVQNLVVHPTHRGNGLGTRMLRALAGHLNSHGIHCLYALGTRGKKARAFFRRVGFHPLAWNVFLRHTR